MRSRTEEYAKLDEDALRKQIFFIMAFIESKRLFLHNEELVVKVKGKTRRLPLILTLAVINALVPRGTMLLYGGHGGGKTTLVKVLGAMMTRMDKSEIEKTILRGHPHLTEEKIIARMDLGKLLRDGEEVVHWRPFVNSFWKIIDEVNRIPPHIQDILFSLLAEGVVKYAGEAKSVKDYVLYATLNPHDVGTFEMGLPFMDRFSIAVPVTMPQMAELHEILFRKEERIHELGKAGLPKVMDEETIKTIWNIVDEIRVPEDTAFFITYLVASMRACVRIRKEVSETIKVGPELCEGCHYNTDNSVCNKVISPPSVRVILDLRRYSKALAWLLGLDEVPISVVYALAPYIIWHRVEFVRDAVEKRPFYGDKLKFAKHLIDLIYKRFTLNYKKYMNWIAKAKKGTLTPTEKNQIKVAANSDIVVKTDLMAKIEQFLNKTYREYRKKIEQFKSKIESMRRTTDTKTLIGYVYDMIAKINSDETLKFHAKSELIGMLYSELFKLTETSITLSLSEWRRIHHIVEAKIAKEKDKHVGTEIASVLQSLLSFIQKINRSLFEYQRKAMLRIFNCLPELKLDVLVSKADESSAEPSIVFKFRGGLTALILKNILSK